MSGKGRAKMFGTSPPDDTRGLIGKWPGGVARGSSPERFTRESGTETFTIALIVNCIRASAVTPESSHALSAFNPL